MTGLSGAAALVAVGGARLGLATASRLAASCELVVVADRSPELRAAVEAIAPNVRFVLSDVTDEDAVREAVDEAIVTRRSGASW